MLSHLHLERPLTLPVLQRMPTFIQASLEMAMPYPNKMARGSTRSRPSYAEWGLTHSKVSSWILRSPSRSVAMPLRPRNLRHRWVGGPYRWFNWLLCYFEWRNTERKP